MSPNAAPAKKDFDLGDYVQVKDRIARFYELFAQGRLVTGEVRLTTEPDGKPRVMVQGLAYRTPDDPLPGVGWSWLELPGNTPYTRGSEIENAETSAWGRAIGSLGILIDLSIASANEVASKQGPEQPKRAAAEAAATVAAEARDRDELLARVGHITRTGAIAKGSGIRSDLEARQQPDGYLIGFRLDVGDGKAIPQVLATGPIGAALVEACGGETGLLHGQKVTVEGELFEVQAPGRRPYHRLMLTRMVGVGWEVPVPTPQPAQKPADSITEAEADVLFAELETRTAGTAA